MKFEFKGIDEFVNVLTKLADDRPINKVINRNTEQLKQRMEKNAVFTQGYSTGETKSTMRAETKGSMYTGVVGPTTEYAPFLINGTRHMEAQDFFRPAVYEQRQIFLSDMAKIFK